MGKTTNIFMLVLICVLSFISCQNKHYAKMVKKYLNAYESKGFNKIVPFLSDTVILVDGDYQKSYSLADFQNYYEWDSVFNPRYKILETSSIDNNVFLTLSAQTLRFEFLGNNPFVTKQKFSFKKNKIYRIEILGSIDIDWKLWTLKRDSLVNWTNKNKPEYSGFIYDMTKTGGENYLKVIDLYKNRKK